MPRTEEHRGIVDARGDRCKPRQKTHDRHHRGNDLLRAREDDRLANLDRATVPIKLIGAVDPEFD